MPGMAKFCIHHKVCQEISSVDHQRSDQLVHLDLGWDAGSEVDFGMDQSEPGVSMGLVTAWAAIDVRQHE